MTTTYSFRDEASDLRDDETLADWRRRQNAERPTVETAWDKCRGWALAATVAPTRDGGVR